MNAYELKQEARRERLENAADKLEAKAGAVLNVGKDHYSRDWAFITQPGPMRVREQWNKKQDRAFADVQQARELREKANSIGAGGISSDNPDAIEQLQAKLADLEARQARMKAINAAHKRYLKDPASLDKAQLSEPEKTMIRNYQPAYSWEPHPFPPYRISNNNANMHRIRERIEALRAKPTESTETTIGDVRIVENADANRLQMFFPGKPSDDIRRALKSAGFRWAPTEGAWQRHLSDYARYQAEQVIARMDSSRTAKRSPHGGLRPPFF